MEMDQLDKLNKIQKIYDGSVTRAKKALFREKYDDAVSFVKSAAYYAYLYVLKYSDRELENILLELSSKLKSEYPNKEDGSGSCVVFYDAFSMDNRGLTQQYIRALMDNNYNFLYITENTNIEGTDIFQELSHYNRVKIEVLPRFKSNLKFSQYIYDVIFKYSPSKIFMHLRPWSVEALIAIAALPSNIKKYNINLTDHTFWLGCSILDYNIEFRNYGCTLSKYERGLNPEQLLLLPYYPIISKEKFQGFPIVKKKGDVFLFAGASLYKIGGNDNVFLKTIKRILDENANTYFLFAGGGVPSFFLTFVKLNKLENRIFYLGFRKDINEVVKNIDIYIDTFPVSGGLMGEYAIVNKKPILILNDKESDSLREDTLASLFSKNTLKVTRSKDEFISRASLLISSQSLREEEGDENFNLVPSREKFGQNFIKTISTNISQVNIDIRGYSHDQILLERQKLSISCVESRREESVAILKIISFKYVIMFPLQLFQLCVPFILVLKKRFLKRLHS